MQNWSSLQLTENPHSELGTPQFLPIHVVVSIENHRRARRACRTMAPRRRRNEGAKRPRDDPPKAEVGKTVENLEKQEKTFTFYTLGSIVMIEPGSISQIEPGLM